MAIRLLPYILQEHIAKSSAGRHYDFRIKYTERNKLASWVLPKANIPRKPGQGVLALRTEDHKMSWLKFYGTIPDGSPGAGTVEILQKGEAELKNWFENQVITFYVSGKYTSGKYSLIRMKKYDSSGQAGWLLIKGRDE